MEKRSGMLYPMMVIASISVILFSIIGIATMTGHVPSALSQKSEFTADAQADKDAAALKGTESSKPADVGNKGIAAKTTSPNKTSTTEQRAFSGRERTAAACSTCGVVESVHAREVKGQGSGLGVVGGAVIGGVLGHQVGSGRGNDLATVAGAVGGGFAGNEIEKNVKKTTQYVVRVRMEDGSYRTVTQAAQPGFTTGDRVRVENGAILARG